MLPKVVGEEVCQPKNSFNVSNTESSILMKCRFFPIRTVCLFIQLLGTYEYNNVENRCILVHNSSGDTFYSCAFPPRNSAGSVTSTIKWPILRHILAMPSTSFLAVRHHA